MRPSVVLDMKRSAVREAVGRFRAANPRVFGSVLHGTDRDGSDLDLLVDALPGATLLDGTVAKLAMRQPFVLFKGLTFQKLCLPGAFRPGDHHNKMLRPGLCVMHASPQYL